MPHERCFFSSSVFTTVAHSAPIAWQKRTVEPPGNSQQRRRTHHEERSTTAGSHAVRLCRLCRLGARENEGWGNGGGCGRRGLVGGVGYTLGWFTRGVLSTDTIEFFEVRLCFVWSLYSAANPLPVGFARPNTLGSLCALKGEPLERITRLLKADEMILSPGIHTPEGLFRSLVFRHRRYTPHTLRQLGSVCFAKAGTLYSPRMDQTHQVNVGDCA